MSKVFMESLLPMFVGLSKRFEKYPDETLKALSGTNFPNKIIISFYDYFVSTGELDHIENIDLGIKSKMWNHVKLSCPGIRKDKAIELSKCIWVLNSIL